MESKLKSGPSKWLHRWEENGRLAGYFAQTIEIINLILHLVPRSRMVELYLHIPYVFMA
jgi:hypothetical protein